MSRPRDPLAPYRITTHKLGAYVYAATQPAKVDERTGKRTYTRIHWGRFDPEAKVFTPNMTFLLQAPEERRKFIFPSDRDITAIERLAGLRRPGRQQQRRHGDRLYGDIRLPEQTAEKLGLCADLRAVFNGNDEMLDMVLTLAMFPSLSKCSYNRLTRRQRVVRAAYDEPLTSPRITQLTQSISTLHRDLLFRLRAKRLGDKALCAVDSTSRSAYGSSLADIRWGKSDLPQTNEVVVYSPADHQPIYYRTFPGNMPDCRTFLPVTQEPDKAGFKSLVSITDRAYETIKNLESVILKGRSLITAAPVSRTLISKHIKAYGDFAVRPASMVLDRKPEIYHEQFEERCVVKTAKKTEKIADRLRINLFFDPELRAKQVKSLDL